jgi:hypothetical protein
VPITAIDPPIAATGIIRLTSVFKPSEGSKEENQERTKKALK